MEWYIIVLTPNKKQLITYNININEWEAKLFQRFKPLKATKRRTLQRKKYSLADAVKHRKFREYAQIIIRAVKVAEVGDKLQQMFIIWDGLDLEFQRNIPEPTNNTTLNRFL